MRVLSTLAWGALFVSRHALGGESEDNNDDREDDREDDDQQEEQQGRTMRGMSTAACLEYPGAGENGEDVTLGYVVGEFWKGEDLDVGDYLDYVDLGNYTDWVEYEGKHYNIIADTTEAQRIWLCEYIRDSFAAAANITQLGWFLYLKEEEDDPQFRCHLEMLKQPDDMVDDDSEASMTVVDCTEIEQEGEEERDRRRLEGDDDENEVADCKGDFIRSYGYNQNEPECPSVCGKSSDEYVYSADVQQPSTLDVYVGSTMTFVPSTETFFEFGTLDSCDYCDTDETAYDNHYNRVIQNATSTKLTFQSHGYRCFLMEDNNCDSRLVVRVLPCDPAISFKLTMGSDDNNDDTNTTVTEISRQAKPRAIASGDRLGDTDDYVEWRDDAYEVVRDFIDACGFGNNSLYYDEYLGEILPSLAVDGYSQSDITFTAFASMYDASPDTIGSDILDCVAGNMTALADALGWTVEDVEIVSDEPTAAPTSSDDAKEEDSDSKMHLYAMIGGGVLVLCLVGIILYACCSGGSSEKEDLLADAQADKQYGTGV